jgi:hypothetical protein
VFGCCVLCDHAVRVGGPSTQQRTDRNGTPLFVRKWGGKGRKRRGKGEGKGKKGKGRGKILIPGFRRSVRQYLRIYLEKGKVS